MYKAGQQAVCQSCPTHIWSWRPHRSWWSLSDRSTEELQEQSVLSVVYSNDTLPSNAEL